MYPYALIYVIDRSQFVNIYLLAKLCNPSLICKFINIHGINSIFTYIIDVETHHHHLYALFCPKSFLNLPHSNLHMHTISDRNFDPFWNIFAP